MTFKENLQSILERNLKQFNRGMKDVNKPKGKTWDHETMRAVNKFVHASPSITIGVLHFYFKGIGLTQNRMKHAKTFCARNK